MFYLTKFDFQGCRKTKTMGDKFLDEIFDGAEF